jgi:hypothetical protein
MPSDDTEARTRSFLHNLLMLAPSLPTGTIQQLASELRRSAAELDSIVQSRKTQEDWAGRLFKQRGGPGR